MTLNKTNGDTPTVVLVADGDFGMAEALSFVLRANGISAVFTSDLRETALVDAALRLRPAVVALDISNGTHPTTIAAIGRLSAMDCRVVVVSDGATDTAAAEAAGASVVVDKSATVAETVGAVLAAFDPPLNAATTQARSVQ